MLAISLRRWGNGWSVCRREAALFSQLLLSRAMRRHVDFVETESDRRTLPA